METLANLKRRLLDLPAIRDGRQHEARYAAFLAKIIPSGEKLQNASNAAAHAGSVLPSPSYAEARKSVKQSASIAARLEEKLAAEPALIGDPSIEKSFTRLFENAGSALDICQRAWAESLQARIKDWETIAQVVARLGEDEEAKSIKVQSRRLKTAIDSLQVAKSRLPRSKQDAATVQADLTDLSDAVAKLDLDTPFGKFLQAAASREGADLSTAQAADVLMMIKKHKLEKVFRVHLSS